MRPNSMTRMGFTPVLSDTGRLGGTGIPHSPEKRIMDSIRDVVADVNQGMVWQLVAVAESARDFGVTLEQFTAIVDAVYAAGKDNAKP